MSTIPKILMGFGALIFVSGLLLYLLSKLGIIIGKFPGDISISLKKISINFPVITSIVISLLLTVLLNILLWFFRK